MWLLDLPPFLPFLIIAFLVFFSRGTLTSVLMLTAPVWGALNLYQLEQNLIWQVTIVELQLTPLRVDKLSLLFGYIFHLASFFAIIYALHVRDKVQQISCLLYTAAALGAVFSGDLLCLFIFWEIMAISSVFLIWAQRSADALSSGLRYLVYQIISGLLLLIGTLFYYQVHANLAFIAMPLQDLASWLIFISFGIKCAFPMLHSWLIDAYPNATPSGTVFLSAFTTKVAVYALARAFAGTELLVYIGAVMTCFPIFYAVIENDLRRVLAYSLLNQIGFMVVGIGIGTQLAVNGAVAHAFNDVLFKGLLFMSMGAVLHMTGRINGSELGGLYKTMPKTTWLCLIGAASISAFPLFNGFISKSMVMSAALNQGYDYIWLVLLFASAGVFHHAGIKIPYFAFFAVDRGISSQDPPNNMLLAMAIAAALCLAIGIYPSFLYQLLPFNTDHHAYDLSHVLAQTQLLCFAALAFVWLTKKGIYPKELAAINLDVDWLYRCLLVNMWTSLRHNICQIEQRIRHSFVAKLMRALAVIEKYHRPHGLLARAQTIGNMALWLAILLACYLALSFITH
jgi:multicomponent Na+:H+ antiporter subunit D